MYLGGSLAEKGLQAENSSDLSVGPTGAWLKSQPQEPLGAWEMDHWQLRPVNKSTHLTAFIRAEWKVRRTGRCVPALPSATRGAMGAAAAKHAGRPTTMTGLGLLS